MAIIAATLSWIKSDPLGSLGGSERINQLFAQAGHVWRDRVLNPATTLGLFMLQVLHGNTAITHLRHLCKTEVCSSSYCDARARLPLVMFVSVIEQLCRDCIRYTQDAAATLLDNPSAWLGRRVLIADATTVTAPDTPALQVLWPQPSVQKSGCGFPMIKLLGLLDLATGMIVQLSMFCLATHEMSQAAVAHLRVRGRRAVSLAGGIDAYCEEGGPLILKSGLPGHDEGRPSRWIAFWKSRYTPIPLGPTPRPSSTTSLARRDAMSRGARLPKLG